MITIGLAAAIFELSHGSDMSSLTPEDLTEWLESLRGYGKLPRGRDRRNQPLTDAEISAALLGLVTPRPKWSGHTATVLCKLKTVGGARASFFGAHTLQEALARIISDDSARKTVVTLTVSGAENGTNSNGSATLLYELDGSERRAFFVSPLALTQLQAGADEEFYFEHRHSPMSRDLVFARSFFDSLSKAIGASRRSSQPLESDGSEYEAEEAREARYGKLGARPGSRFLNVGVDNQVAWPSKEVVVQFDRYSLVLMPKTREYSNSIHIDLTANRLNDRDAITVINRFLSVMTWCDDQFAIAQMGWSGNPVPVPVSKRDLAFTTALQWVFDRKIPTDEKVRRALAIYREARNAQQNFMISYAVLNYYKIIEIGHNGRGDVKNWFRDNFEGLRKQPGNQLEFERFLKSCGTERPHEYIYDACRLAVAHAGRESTSDPDDANELTRLHTAADVLRVFARHFITSEFGISDLQYSGT